MPGVRVERVTKVYPGDVKAVDDVSLDVEEGEFMILVGPSGCGKTTPLRMIAGLETVTSGRIELKGRDVTNVPARDRDVAMVFQSYALYPHMTVRQNLGLNLQVRKVPRAEIKQRVEDDGAHAALDHLLDRKPGQLSGGQRQRVALGRAVIRRPNVFLMDEPLSNLDLKLREETRTELKKLHENLRITTVYVTHDQSEAMTLGDRIAVMHDGVLLQVGVPQRLFERPANLFVGTFIGSPAMNLVEAHADRGEVSFGTTVLRVPGTAGANQSARWCLGSDRPRSRSPARSPTRAGRGWWRRWT